MKWSIDWNKLKLRLGKYRWPAVILLAGMALMLWPGGNERAENGSADTGTHMTTSGFDLETLEIRLEDTLSQIAGVGEVTVVLTLRSSGEEVFACDINGEAGSQDRETVIVSGGSGVEMPVTVQRIYPQFQGALIVCTGGNDPAVRLSVTEAVSAVTGLSSDKISICQRK